MSDPFDFVDMLSPKPQRPIGPTEATDRIFDALKLIAKLPPNQHVTPEAIELIVQALGGAALGLARHHSEIEKLKREIVALHESG